MALNPARSNLEIIETTFENIDKIMAENANNRLQVNTRGAADMKMTVRGKAWPFHAIHLSLAAYVVLILTLTACSVATDTSSNNTDIEDPSGQSVTMTIDAPSASELVIAPGRHFKVSGTLEGDVPEDAALKVALLDANGREVRFASSDAKGTDRVITSW